MMKVSKNLKRSIMQNRIYLSALIVLLCILSFLTVQQPGVGYAVRLNGQHIGYAKNIAHVESVAADVDAYLRESKGQEIFYERDFEYIKGKLAGHELTDDTTLQTNIVNSLDIKVPAYLIKSDGNILMAVKAEEDALAALNKIKEPFLEGKENAKAEFLQEVDIVSANKVSVEKVISRSQALSMVSPGKELALVTRANIFRNANRANESSDAVSMRPILDVKVTYNDKAKLPVYRAEKRVPDASMTEGKTKILDEGSNGIKEVYREIVAVNGKVTDKTVLSETVLKESTPKIVAYGTKPKVSGIVTIAKQYIGVPYRWGGTTPKGFDCSGFTQYVYRKAGVSLPRTSYQQRSVGKKVSRSELRPGDLVLFPGHVGIYVGDGMYIHAPEPGDSVKISKLSSSSKAFLYGRRVQ